MASRSRTFLFIQYRSSYGHSSARKRKDGYSYSSNTSIEYAGLIQDNSAQHEIFQMSELPPHWVEEVQNVHAKLAEIENKGKLYQKLHSKHLLPGFMDRTEEEREINDITQHITNGFQHCQKSIHAIYDKSHEGKQLLITKNVQMSLAQKLQTQSKNFQVMQSQYLKDLSKRNNQSKDVFNVDDEIDKRRKFEFEQDFDLSLTNEQAMELGTQSTAILDREEDVKNIYKSINELSNIFKDMQQLVISQGTLLDRIDYNVENTVVNIQAAINQHYL
ncbi:hypothetical protein BB561_000273 [Smittium simulii]|uniref:t-SNARE coiled-coil homology domain-containing protein n=1 Tax=Smittium simulii TaxID=133385 RepID=A0A2T9YZZ1_9FUNG|nr:hypothetical protein BB561_000273 [Smittium simulii]